ncbi:MAG TPA: MFS transporter [Pseudolabrys sp.]|jgi:EmrB/QacA subfamily drug resistance transporter
MISIRSARALPLLVAGTMFMEQLDGTILVTALPNIAHSFHVTAAELDLSVSGYLVTLAVMIPASGWIANRFGPKRIFGLSITLFIVASMLCGLSHSQWQLVAARILQGFGGATMVPVGRLLVLRETDKKDLIKAIAYLTWPALSAPLLGPPLGGLLTTYASWHWIFYINVPLGLIALFFVWKVVPNTKEVVRSSFDIASFFLIGAASLGFLYGIELLGRPASGFAASLGLLAFAVICGFLAVRRGLTRAAPLIPFSAFKELTFRISMRGGGVFRGCLSAVPFLLPLLFQVGFGLDPVTSGTLLLAVFAGNLGMKPTTSWILRHVGFRRSMIVSACVAIATMLGCAALTGATPHLVIIGLLFVSGLARSMQFTTVSTLAFSDVPKPQMASANTLFSIQQQGSNACGVAVAGAIARLSSYVREGGAAQTATDFHVAFLVVAAIALVAMTDFFRVPKNAGAELH